jgi:hypothetical protein
VDDDGLQLILKAAPPAFGDHKCDDCGATIELHPRQAQDVIAFASGKEIDEGAEEARKLVERMKRGER